MEFKIGDVVKRPHWERFGVIVDQKPGLIRVRGMNKGEPELALWYNAATVDWEKKEPKGVKLGDVIKVEPHPDGNYTVTLVKEDGHTVKLQHFNGMPAHGFYNLKDFPNWSINGVKCSQFFGEDVQQEDVNQSPPRKKRIYNA